MADTKVALRWTGAGLQFEAEHPSGNAFKLDGDGRQSHSPVQALALALAGCTAADVVDIATKMRVPFKELHVEVEADRNAEPPRYFQAVRMVFHVTGVAAEDEGKIQRALDLSHEKYCSVLHSLRKDISISTRVLFS
ncbi:MAG TPA: OsmC family protein [Longimicrobiales bacterium]|nr:OsmC family protein [Longimicrobiales bacterium]